MMRIEDKNTLTAVLVILIAIGLPLFFSRGGYPAINYAKCLYLVAVLVVLVAGLSFYAVKDLTGHRHLPEIHFDLLDATVLAYMVLSVVSGFVSENFNASFYGYGLCCGTLAHICGGLSYFWISRHCTVSRRLVIAVVTAWSLIYVWTFANAFGINLFGLYDNLQMSKIDEYVSCLGHCNIASGFFCFTVPLTGVFFIRSSLKSDFILYGISLFLGMLASLGICVDGLWYGFLPASAFVLSWALADCGRHRRLWIALLICSVSLVIFRLLLAMGLVHRLESASVFLAEHWIGEFLLAVSLVMLAVLKRRPCLSVPYVLRKTLSIGLLSLFVLILFGTFFLGFTNPFFGTGRGAVWKGCVWTFRTYSPLEMLFGIGNGGFHTRLTIAVNLMLNRPLLNAPFYYFFCHNSILHVLLAQGVLGATTLIAGVYAFFHKAFMHHREIYFDKAIPTFVAIVAYFSQSMLYSSNTLNVMMLFLMLALFKGSLMKKEV